MAKPLEAHRSGACGCSPEVNPRQCVYQEFPDGWDFVPDAGNGKSRGEVFTPRWVVEKMLQDSGLVPPAYIAGDYSDPTGLLPLLEARVIEPAVGVGNFSSVILWQKLQAVHHQALEESSGDALSLKRYQQLFLTAVASLYSYDVDCGNSEVTRRRLLGRPLGAVVPIAAAEEAWREELWAAFTAASHTELSQESLGQEVARSLAAAESAWGEALRRAPEGVACRLYREHTGRAMPLAFFRKCERLVRANHKLFNGLLEEDSVSGLLTPGYGQVVWQWWTVSRSGGLTSQAVSYRAQLLEAEVEALEVRLTTLEATGKTAGVTVDLFGESEATWRSRELEVEWRRGQDALKRLQDSLRAVRESLEDR